MLSARRRLIRQLEERTESDDVRRDLAAVEREVAQLADRTVDDAIQDLMRRGPAVGVTAGHASVRERHADNPRFDGRWRVFQVP